jgi:hypothetical protein
MSHLGRGAIIVVVVGLATGILTQLGQSLLPDAWSPLANAISPWLAVAFVVGAELPDRRSAAVGGAAVLLLALAGYYAMTEIRFGIGAGTGSIVRWGVAAIVGGPVFGIAGNAWRRGRSGERAIATGLLAAAFVVDGIYQIAGVDHVPAGELLLAIGIAIPIALGHSASDRIRAAAVTVPAVALGALGYLVLIWFDGVSAGVH